MPVSINCFAKRARLIGTLMLALAGCGDADEAAAIPNADDDPIAASLVGLGVDISLSTRVDDDGDPLPASYRPLGTRSDFAQTRELLVVGVLPSFTDGQPGHLSDGHFHNPMALVSLVPQPLSESGLQGFDESLLFSPDALAAPWAEARGDEPPTLRAITRADLDGDGRDELVVVFWERSPRELFVQTYEDSSAQYATTAPVSLGHYTLRELVVERGDFDGDGDDDLAIALATDEGAQLQLVGSDGPEGPLTPSIHRSLPQTLPEGITEVALATGNLDYDRADELVVLVGEQRRRPNEAIQGVTRYYALDDANHEFVVVAQAPVEADTEGGRRSAITADLAVGDIDGDTIDELVLAGLTHFDADGDCDYSYLLVALDDYKRRLAPLGAREQDTGLSSDCSVQAPLELRRVHVNTLDLDADHRSEIQVGRFIYEDFAHSPAFTARPEAELAPERLFGDQEGFSGRWDRDHSDIVTGDFTSDGRDDLAVYSQATHTLDIWGIAEPDERWALQFSLPLTPLSPQGAVRPLLVAPNTKSDGLTLRYDAGEPQLIFTQPIVLAALAAAPCYEDLGQNLFTCRTQFGTAQSDTLSTENSVTVRASAKVGFSHKFSFLGLTTVGAELTQTVEASASLATSHAYTLTKSISYTTGPIEDTVIFTTIPYDRYTYSILSHPDESLIGAEVVVSLPRSPVELQVTRDFYNTHIEAGGMTIDESVFRHQAGDPWSYPRTDQKDSLLAQFEGFEVGPQMVGEGTGNESLGINVYTQTGTSVGWGASFTTSVVATAGALVTGFSVGSETRASLQISHGQESRYVGTISNLPDGNFADHAYSVGLFTYVHEDPDSGQFEVVNYWVD